MQTDFREARALAAADVRHDVDELVELDAPVRVLIDFLDQLSNLRLKPLSIWQERNMNNCFWWKRNFNKFGQHFGANSNWVGTDGIAADESGNRLPIEAAGSVGIFEIAHALQF